MSAEVLKGGMAAGDIVGSIVSWCDALNGSVSLRDGLNDLVAGLGAEAGMLIRTDMQDLRTAPIATVDLATGMIARRPLHRSFADSFFGAAMASARTGTIWIGSSFGEDNSGDPGLGDWQASRRTKDFVVLVLSAGGKKRDHIELHFRERLTEADERALAAIMPNLVRVWAGRKAGLISHNAVVRRLPEVRGRAGKVAPATNILSVDNPVQLSRAEFRVCLLLSRGLLVRAVAQELKLSEATIRTHLRNIYAKTESGSLAELVFRLMNGRPAQDLPDAHYA